MINTRLLTYFAAALQIVTEVEKQNLMNSAEALSHHGMLILTLKKMQMFWLEICLSCLSVFISSFFAS